MKRVFIEETIKTPSMLLDPDEGIIELRGRSIPDNAIELYEPVVNEWLGEYIKNPQLKTTAVIQLEYYNTSTSMWIFQLLKKLQTLHKRHYEVVINWYYADEDSLESAEDYQALIPMNYNMISYTA